MWKLPFLVLGSEAYAYSPFSTSDECMEKCGTAILEARRQVQAKRMEVGTFWILKYQTVALPGQLFDQRLLGIGDMPGAEFESNRPTQIQFGA